MIRLCSIGTLKKSTKRQMTLDGTPCLSDMCADSLATYCVLRSRLDRDDLVEEEVACAYRASHRTAVERGCVTRGTYPGLSGILFFACLLYAFILG